MWKAAIHIIHVVKLADHYPCSIKCGEHGRIPVYNLQAYLHTLITFIRKFWMLY